MDKEVIKQKRDSHFEFFRQKIVDASKATELFHFLSEQDDILTQEKGKYSSLHSTTEIFAFSNE